MSESVETLLRELARDVRIPEPSDELTGHVLARVAAAPPARTPLRSRLSRRLRWLLTVVVALLIAGLALSPVGAQVGEWLGFHGVVVTDNGPSDGGQPIVPGETPGLSLEEAAAQVGFEPVVPAELGPPDAVAVSLDGALLSMSWGRGDETVRLDQFDGTLDPVFWKMAVDAERVDVAGGDALWLPRSHDVVVLPPQGGEQRLASRLAAQTLVWPHGRLTLRLEGHLTLDRAIEIAESAR